MLDSLIKDDTDIKAIVDVKYYLLIRGTIPEVGPMVAFRRSGRTRSQGRKLIKCPYCTARITSTELETKVEMFAIAPTSLVDCQFTMTCYNCKNDVGMNFIIPAY